MRTLTDPVSTLGQEVFWATPVSVRDATPIEPGGAILVARLTPAEVGYLTRLGYPTLVDALHGLLANLMAVAYASPEMDADLAS